jgi:hypothetical protein
VTPGIVAQAVEAAARVRDAGHARTFRHAVAGFIRVIGSVPDEGVGAISAEGERTLLSLGQDVIERIEERVADAPGGDARELVSAVYEIRRLLEEADRFMHHYAIARPV